MSNLGNMVARIQRETRRANGGSADESRTIKDCIADAIDDFKSDRFAFNVQDFTLSLQQGVYTYTSFVRSDGTTALPASQVYDIDFVRYERDGSWYHLEPASASILDSYRNPSSNDGWPQCFGWYGQSFTLYPSPSETSTMSLRGIVALDDDNSAGSLFAPATSPDTFASAWFGEGERLIRQQALYHLYTVLLDNPERAGRHAQAAALEHARLRARQAQLEPRNSVEPCY